MDQDNKNKGVTQLKIEKGAALVIALLVMAVLSLLGAAFLTISSTESQIAFNERDSIQALYIAEAGLARAKRDLLYDTYNDINGFSNRYLASPDGLYTDSDGTKTGTPGTKYYDLGSGAPSNSFYAVPYSSTTLGKGSYSLEFKNEGFPYSQETIVVKSTGTTPSGAKRVLEAKFRVEGLSPWNNAIFSGAGSSGGSIKGNALIAGSVHILGTDISPGEPVIVFTGDSGIANYYKDMDSNLENKVQALDSNPASLNAQLRVKKGRVDLDSNSSTIGEKEDPKNKIKETLNRVYNNDGFGGSFGAKNVYSDNGVYQKYDVPGSLNLSFPGVSDSDYSGNSLSLTAADLKRGDGKLVIDEDTPAFSKSDVRGINSISWSPLEKEKGKGKDSGELVISGIIYVDGNLTLGSEKLKEGIQYSGRGSIYSGGTGGGTIEIKGDLLPKNTFPTQDALGLIAKDKIKITSKANLLMAAALYAQNEIVSQKQNQIAGAMVSRYFDMGQGSPRIYQVPSLPKYLPPGLPGSKPTYFMKTLYWKEITP